MRKIYRFLLIIFIVCFTFSIHIFADEENIEMDLPQPYIYYTFDATDIQTNDNNKREIKDISGNGFDAEFCISSSEFL